MRSNITGTYNLLEAARAYWNELDADKQENFLFLHVSTDEVYGRGENVRDWLYVEDHARALHTVLEKGQPGRTYNIGGRCEKKNIEVVTAICNILNEIKPAPGHRFEIYSIRHAPKREGGSL